MEQKVVRSISSEMRWDPIARNWVIIAPERGKRPGSFALPVAEKSPAEEGHVCPFCRGNEHLTPPAIRVLPNGASPGQWKARVVPNKYPVLRVEGELERQGEGMYDYLTGIGAHEVVVETPDCSRQFTDFSASEMLEILKIYRDRLNDLKGDLRFRHILIFKNHGRPAGATMFHSHSQIIALPERPSQLQVALGAAREYYSAKERCIFCDIIRHERETKSRVVYEDEHFLAISPYASPFPFMVQVFPKKHSHDYGYSDDLELSGLSQALKNVFIRINRVLNNPPYNFIIKTAPITRSEFSRMRYWDSIERDFHWSIQIIPRITLLAGFEWGTGITINPVAPEEAAGHLRAVKVY